MQEQRLVTLRPPGAAAAVDSVEAVCGQTYPDCTVVLGEARRLQQTLAEAANAAAEAATAAAAAAAAAAEAAASGVVAAEQIPLTLTRSLSGDEALGQALQLGGGDDFTVVTSELVAVHASLELVGPGGAVARWKGATRVSPSLYTYPPSEEPRSRSVPSREDGGRGCSCSWPRGPSHGSLCGPSGRFQHR